MISPEATRLLTSLADRRRIKWLSRTVRAADVNRADILIAATSDMVVNKKIRSWAKRRNILVNVVDCAELSNFISPAIFHSSKTVVAVYTHGRDPVLSRDLKNFLKEKWDEFLRYRNRP
jgi:siroheme synthase-like protein